MRILLVAMPDTSEVLSCSTFMPNLGLVSLAGQLVGHQVRVLDLVAHRPKIRQPLLDQLRSFQPDLVGLSAMTFQFDTLLRIARFIRSTIPSVRLAAGGYHPTLMARELAADPSLPLDFLIRGEGEASLVELVDALQTGRPPDAVAGLSYRAPDGWRHNPDRPLLDLATLRLPDRAARVCRGFHYYGIPMDVAETSRGCPFNCKFCSITHMYGHSFRPFPIDRIVADLRDVRARGTRAVFLADDNITFDIAHFRRVCQAIEENGLNDLTYSVQTTAAGLAQNLDLVAAMDRANIRSVFVGLESMDPRNLASVNKPTSPDINRRAAEALHQHHIALIAGIIVGFPDDTRDSIRENMRLFRQLRPDSIFALYLTPGPKTRIREELLAAGLVDNPDDFSTYDGFSCNTHTHSMTRVQLFRALKIEALRYALQPRQLRDNFYLRQNPRAVLASAAKILALDLYNVLTGRRYAQALDL